MIVPFVRELFTVPEVVDKKRKTPLMNNQKVSLIRIFQSVLSSIKKTTTDFSFTLIILF